jgi:hypothetical protein
LKVDEATLTNDVTGTDWSLQRKDGAIVFNELGPFRTWRENGSDVMMGSFEVDDSPLDDGRVDRNYLSKILIFWGEEIQSGKIYTLL